MATKVRDAEIVERVISGNNSIDMGEIAADFNIPVSTLYRRISNLIGQGLIIRVRRGYYVPNPVLTRVYAQFDANTVLGNLVLPHLKALHAETGLTTHFGVFEDDMVTYIAKVSQESQSLFTEVNGQLEAYCSGVGKVLLASLAPQELEAYLESGAFPKVTANTIVDPDLIRHELQLTAKRQYAVDDGEIEDELFCLAIPVLNKRGDILGALSVSSNDKAHLFGNRPSYIEVLKESGRRISTRVYSA